MRIVCFHLNQVGDLMFSLPALKSVRESYPNASITSVVRPSLQEVLASTGLVDEILIRPTGAGASKISLARKLWSPGFDLALVFSQSGSSAVFACLSRAAKRIGFINTSCGMLLSQRVDFNHPPSTENNLRLVKAAGCEIITTEYAGLLKPTPDQTARADKLLSDHGIKSDDCLVALSPGTSGRRSVKEWTDEGFAAVGKHLAERGCRTLLLGSMRTDNVVKECGEILDIGGQTSLADAAAILKRCKALVSVDSGILHLCAAVGTSVVGLYGPSNPCVTGPQGEGHIVLSSQADCSPCMRTECSYERKCMTAIDPEAVIGAVDSILSGQGQGSTGVSI